jgi:CO/xanthine dehydrogenase Mo-binding subunit
MLATTKRHPGRVRHRTGLSEAGRIVSMEIDVLLDGGAYCTLSPVVLSRAAIHAAGPYDCRNVRIVAVAAATNRPPFGAFRGFGAPQTLFALEVHVDECARRVGMDPVEFRRRNLIRPGGRLATGQLVGPESAAGDVLEDAVSASRFEARRAAARTHNGSDARTRRGVGLAVFHHGSGFTGSGETTLASVAGLRGNADGSVTVLSAQTEIGQGTRTILAQAAADGLGVDVAHVRTEDPDTSVMPNSGPTVASRTGMVVGGLLYRAGRELRARIERAHGSALDADAFLREIGSLAAKERVEHLVRYEPPTDIRWNDETYRGDAYAAYSWA